MLIISTGTIYATELGCSGTTYLNFSGSQIPVNAGEQNINVVVDNNSINIISNQYGINKRFINPAVGGSYFAVDKSNDDMISIDRNSGRIQLIRRNLSNSLNSVVFFGICNVGFINPKF